MGAWKSRNDDRSREDPSSKSVKGSIFYRHLVLKSTLPILQFEYPFDIGIIKNISSVLGNNPLLWLWPSRQNTGSGDGLSFPVLSHIDPQSQYLWPPRDPDDLRPSIFSSKYKRQQERKQQQRLKQHNNATSADDGGDNDSEDYYDSGSFVTDSEDEYSLTDEEQHMNKFVSNSVYNLAGVIPDDSGRAHHRARWDDTTNDTLSASPSHYRTKQHQHLYRSSPSSQASAHTPQLSYPDDSSDNDDDDTIPLSSLLTTRTPPVVATKAIKED